ncbi:sperm-associated antigen 8 [Paroedura picta]|uniref:sperm-associated antigen 8 n=1 Tax=Paroedura picta TaxID=143630 RepID=UPI004055EAFC
MAQSVHQYIFWIPPCSFLTGPWALNAARPAPPPANGSAARPPRAPLRLRGDEDAAGGMEPSRWEAEGGGEAAAKPEEEEEEEGATMAAEGPVLVERPACGVELPPCCPDCPPGPVLAELPPAQALLLPAPPPEPSPAAPQPPRGHCLLRNWQEERATNALDEVPGSGDGSTEGFFFRHGHRGLLTLHSLAGLARSTTTQDAYRRPCPTGRPIRGQREAMMQWLLYQKYSKEAFAEDVDPPPGPMESVSTMQRDYHREGLLSVLPTPTQPHNYRTEQPQTFWLEHAQQVPGVSSIQTGDTPFRKNASFSTPAGEPTEQTKALAQ